MIVTWTIRYPSIVGRRVVSKPIVFVILTNLTPTLSELATSSFKGTLIKFPLLNIVIEVPTLAFKHSIPQ
jgi:hypothetical protein